MRTLRLAAIFLALSTASAALAQAPADNDHTLSAMRDEMARSKARLQLQIPRRISRCARFTWNIACSIWTSAKWWPNSARWFLPIAAAYAK